MDVVLLLRDGNDHRAYHELLDVEISIQELMEGVVAHFVLDAVELSVDDSDGKALSAVRVDVDEILGLSCHCRF